MRGEKLDSIGRAHRGGARSGSTARARAPVGSCFCFASCVGPITSPTKVPLERALGPDSAPTDPHPAVGWDERAEMLQEVAEQQMVQKARYSFNC